MSSGNSWAQQAQEPPPPTPMKPAMSKMLHENGLRELAAGNTVPKQLGTLNPLKCFAEVKDYKTLQGLAIPPDGLKHLEEPFGMFQIQESLGDLKVWINSLQFDNTEIIEEKHRMVREIGLRIGRYGTSLYSDSTMKLYVELVDDFLNYFAGMTTSKPTNFFNMMRRNKLQWIALSLKAQDIRLKKTYE